MVRTLTASALVALLGFTSASPVIVRDVAGLRLHKRQTAACAPMMVIFARGTTEAAPIGSVVGPPLQSALETMAGGAANVNMQGVDYAADIAGFTAGGDAQGSKTMAKMVTDAAASCPDSKIVMSGYSQGGQLVHNAATMLDATTASKVSATVIFGDPDNPKPVAQVSTTTTKVFCADGDLICKGQAIVRAPHLSYGDDAGAAAQFIMSAVAGSGNGTASVAGAATNGTATAETGSATNGTASVQPAASTNGTTSVEPSAASNGTTTEAEKV